MRAHRLSCGVLAAALGIAASAAVFATPQQFPPIVDPSTSERHDGKVVFVELLTPDIATSKQFYGSLFGWNFQDFQFGSVRYSQAYLDGRPVAGMVHRDIPSGQRRQPTWLTFLSSRDVLAARVNAVQRGAKVLFEPHRIPNRGQEAVFADPQGAVFAVLTSSNGDPPDEIAAPGEWIWSSLMAADPDADAAFYQDVFGYEVFEVGPEEGQHLMLATDGYARASANPLAVNDPAAHSHWLNYVRVDDAVRMAARVTALGGRVLVEPRLDRHGGMVTIVADPMGAPFGMLEWTDTQSKEVVK